MKMNYEDNLAEIVYIPCHIFYWAVVVQLEIALASRFSCHLLATWCLLGRSLLLLHSC